MKRDYYDCDSAKGVTPSASSGFALILALSLMALVLLLILSLSSLVQVETQVVHNQKYLTEAQQNAILGLSLAIGELQTTLGPDQRISASSDILSGSDATKRHLTGVWVSDPDGTSVAGQSYAEGDLIRWLVSDGVDASGRPVSGYHTSAVAADAVTLVGEGSVSDVEEDGLENDSVQVGLSAIEDSSKSGRYAWWIGDEGVKATISLSQTSYGDSPNADQAKHQSILNHLSNHKGEVAVIDQLSSKVTTSVDMSNFVSASDLVNAYQNVDEDDAKAEFHDLTAWSKGVLADARNGGLKKDLSLLFELPDSEFDLSAYGAAGPNRISVFGYGNTSLWSEPLFVAGDAAGPSWNLLRDYYRFYHRMEKPMTDPTLQGQDHYPSMSDMRQVHGMNRDTSSYQPALVLGGGVPSEGDWTRINGYQLDTQFLGDEGDSLRFTNRIMPYMIRLPYLPYLQRFLLELGAFRADQMTNADGDPVENVYIMTRGSAVFHNPYNVKIDTPIMAFNFQEMYVNLEFEEDPTDDDSNFVINGAAARPGNAVYAPGQVVACPMRDWFADWGPTWGIYGDWSGRLSGIAGNWDGYTQRPSDDPFDLNYGPFVSSNPDEDQTYKFWIANMVVGPSLRDGEPQDSIAGVNQWDNPVTLTNNDLSGTFFLDAYFSADEPIVENMMGAPRSTSPKRISAASTRNNPTPIMGVDYLLKPAIYTDQNTRYPAYAFTNPGALVTSSANLFPDPGSGEAGGFPLLSPDRQFRILDLPPSGATVINEAWGNTIDANGKDEVVMIDLPTFPLMSIGSLQNAQLSHLAQMPALAVANSFASPYIDPTKTLSTFNNWHGQSRLFYDLSYLSNEALWDAYFFSSYSIPYDSSRDDYNEGSDHVGDSFDAAFDTDFSNPDFLTGALPDKRMKLLPEEGESLDAIKSKLFESSGDPLDLGYLRSAENLLMEGSFNVNSTSVDAWVVILSAARGLATYFGNTEARENDHTQISRLSQPLKGVFDGDEEGDEAWAGFRHLSDVEIRTLATAIVAELKERVATVNNNRPYLSLAEFVNRSLRSDRYGRSGLLQSAIDQSGINDDFSQSDMEVTSASLNDGNYGRFPEPGNILDANGNGRSAAAGAPAYVLQGDVLTTIGSFIQVRSDTFRVRAYGDVLHPLTGDVLSSAVCEAVLQRVPKPVFPSSSDPEDSDYWVPDESRENLGRAFRIVSFRWLSPDEI
ncbi:hypothetical protein [Coraliomargarita parva]|uniref:hypothetical protein n=1 Tax=Coraliomargarita parva TaxID=3014050 RepID=UPI0022B3B7C9|nr:hypothetical protein [Coraliomargarita parva]